MNHFISVNQLSNNDIFRILHQAESLKKNPYQIEPQLFVANLFFEPSTRTKTSFMVAQRKLGLDILDFHIDSSSVLKGESLYDTAKTFESIGADLLVIRHQSDNWFEELKNRISIPVINAGAGKTEHPTQCLLDLLTIYQEFGTFEHVKIVIAGDIKHSRVAHSNAVTLKRLGADVYLSAAPGFEDEKLGFPYISIDEAIETCDVVMLLRIQHERHIDKAETVNYLNLYGLTKEREARMKKDAIIMHPAPVNRGVEIDTDVVEYPRSRIFKQMENGVYVRMAIIQGLMEKWGRTHANAHNQREMFATIK